MMLSEGNIPCQSRQGLFSLQPDRKLSKEVSNMVQTYVPWEILRDAFCQFCHAKNIQHFNIWSKGNYPNHLGMDKVYPNNIENVKQSEKA